MRKRQKVKLGPAEEKFQHLIDEAKRRRENAPEEPVKYKSYEHRRVAELENELSTLKQKHFSIIAALSIFLIIPLILTSYMFYSQRNNRIECREFNRRTLLELQNSGIAIPFDCLYERPSGV